MTTITKEKGERLNLRITAKAGEATVDLSDGYTVDAWIKSVRASRTVYETMSPTIDGDGRIVIDYDTVNLSPGTYEFDLRFTKAGADAFTHEFTFILNSTVTPPSAR